MFAVILVVQVFELGPSLFMVEVQKAEGNTQEYDTVTTVTQLFSSMHGQAC